ncbi:MAG: hypothetical protein N3C12_07815 [Candidatus Binatia bacterium]|nr:hypothetical protein [Candidatus Binatia bacterium]
MAGGEQIARGAGVDTSFVLLGHDRQEGRWVPQLLVQEGSRARCAPRWRGFVAVLAVSFVLAAVAEGQLIFVNAAASGANNGSTWSDAFTKLQDALAAASAGQDIWVARGVYYPDEGGGQTNNDRLATFQLKNGVGGFAGGESSLAQRNQAVNITVLSGDIDQNDTVDANGIVLSHADIAGDNSYQVVRGSNTNASATVDGFTITGGLANGSVTPCGTVCGAGMLNDNGSPTLFNLVFAGNFAANAGGDMANVNGSSPVLTNVRFFQNRAGQGGRDGKFGRE